VLKPDSTLPGYVPIVLEANAASELRVIGEYLTQLTG